MARLFQTYKHRLNTFLFFGILAALPFGYFTPDLAQSFSFVGDLFLRSLSLMIIPIIFISVLSGILQFDQTEQLGRVGIKTVIYYAVTTALAVITGLIMVNLIEPGKSELKLETAIHQKVDQQSASTNSGGLLEVTKKIIPTNIIQAASEGNVLGLIFFTVILGLALLKHPGSGQEHIRQIVNVLFSSLIWMVDLIMLFAPIGIFALIGNLIAETILSKTINTVGYEIFRYSLTVLAGLAIHGGLTLTLLLKYFKVSPIGFFKDMLPALLTAFSTASSAATLPITIDSLENRSNVPNKIAGFVASLGATVNMDGTAIYEAVAAVFIANIYGIELSFNNQLVVFLTATFSAIGAAGIPGAGLIMMTLVLSSVGLPAEGIGLIVVVDRILDMFRTCINVWGDSIGAKIIAVGENESHILKE